MHYFIDGYNLLFRYLYEDDRLSVQREIIIADLNTKLQNLEIEVTLVFDAQYQLGDTSRSHFQNLEILFSAQGETADDLILEEIKRERHPRQVVVVTSDKKLAWFARRSSAKTESVEYFMNWLNKRYKNKQRSIKKVTNASSSVKVKENIPPKAPPIQCPHVPTPKASPEECFDYYLDQFQKELESITEKKVPKKQSQSGLQRTKSKRKMKKPPEEPIQDHMMRWLEIFERKIDEDTQI